MTIHAQALRRDRRPTATVRGGVFAAVIGTAALVVGFLAGGGGPDRHQAAAPLPSAGPTVSPSPSATPGATPRPTVNPAPTTVPATTADPTPGGSPTTSPGDGGSDAIPLTVELDNATGANVHVDIVDRPGILVAAGSGEPGDGASVEPYRLRVENVDARSLRLTWVDYPIDNALALYIDRVGDGYRLLLVQPEPAGPTDSIAFDRELILTFSEAVSAAAVEAFLQDGLDTPG
jgi:hypothetical protein